MKKFVMALLSVPLLLSLGFCCNRGGRPVVASPITTKADLTMDVLFKILTPQEWKGFQEAGVYRGSELDVKDGFIHIAFADQYPHILKKFFKDRRPLILVKIDAKRLKAGALKVESNRPGGEKYPHLYGEIPIAAVISHEVLGK